MGHLNGMTKNDQKESGSWESRDKEELRSVGTTNRKKMESGTTVLPGKLMGSGVMCPGWREVDKREHPRATTHHLLIFQNQQT